MRRVASSLLMCGLAVCVFGWLAGSVRAEHRVRGLSASRPAASLDAVEGPASRPGDDGPAAYERGWRGPGRDRAEGGGWRGPGPRRGGPEDPTLSPGEREELMAFMHRHFPDMHRRLQRSAQKEPAAYDRAMRRLGPPMARMMGLTRNDPELAAKLIAEHRVEMQIEDLQAAWARGGARADRAALEARLGELVARRFDLRQQRLELEIRAMRKRLDQARARLEQQAARKSQLVDGEVNRILNRLDRAGQRESESRPAEGVRPRAFPGGGSPGRGRP